MEKRDRRVGGKEIQSERQTRFPSICENVHEKRNYQKRGRRRSSRRGSCMGAAVADAAAEMRFHSSDGGERVMNRSLRRLHQHHQQAAQLKGSQLLLQQSQAVPVSPSQPPSDTNIKHIIIQWIIRCNQSVLKHHKSKPAEPKREPRQRSARYPFPSYSPPPSRSLSYRIICSYRYTTLASCRGFVPTCNTLDSLQCCASASSARVAHKVLRES